MNNTSTLVYIIFFAFALVITALSEKKLIPRLTEKAKQPIYTEGPLWHLKKKGTPTMGGLGFIFSALIILVLSVLYLISNEEIYFAKSIILSFASDTTLIPLALSPFIRSTT